MAGQGWLFKFVASTGVKNVLNINKFTTINYQQQAGLKHATLEKLKMLNLPEKPKKPLPPYFRFMMEHREGILKRNPYFKLVDIVRQCSSEWSNIHQDVKEKYTTEFKREMEDYNKKYLEYQTKLSQEQKDALSAAAKEKKHDKKMREVRKKNKAAGKPKRPMGPYMLFLMDVSQKENKKVNELMMTIKGKWNELPEEEKKKYTLRYEESKKQYELEMQKWESKMIKEGNEDLVRRKAVPSSKPSRLLDMRPAKEE